MLKGAGENSGTAVEIWNFIPLRVHFQFMLVLVLAYIATFGGHSVHMYAAGYIQLVVTHAVYLYAEREDTAALV